jgi:hypothetical protein
MVCDSTLDAPRRQRDCLVNFSVVACDMVDQDGAPTSAALPNATEHWNEPAPFYVGYTNRRVLESLDHI